VTRRPKRQRTEEKEDREEVPAAKQQKVATVETMEINDRELPLWADESGEESDF